jgi:hypothetical protein
LKLGALDERIDVDLEPGIGGAERAVVGVVACSIIIPVATIILAVVVTSFPPFTFYSLLVAISAAKVFLPLVCLVKFVPPVPCLSAIVAMVFNGLMQLPVGVGNPAVTIVPVIGFGPRRRCKKGQRAQHNPRRYPSQYRFNMR